MLLRGALWMQNIPEVLLREEELIPSLISGFCAPGSALRDTPGRGGGGDRSLQSGRRNQSSGQHCALQPPVATPPWGVRAKVAMAVMVGSKHQAAPTLGPSGC